MFSKFFVFRYHCRVLRRVQILLNAGGLAELWILQALELTENRFISDERWRKEVGRDLNQEAFEAWLGRVPDAARQLKRLRGHPGHRVEQALEDS